MVADSKAYCKRTRGLCLEQRVGLITLVPRTCTVRQEAEAWGQQHGALPARKTWSHPPGAAATLAWATYRPPRASGVRCGAPRRGRDTLAGGPLEPVGAADGGGVCCRPSQGSRAYRSARPARGSAVVCLCRCRGGGHRRLGRPWAGTAGPQATPVALSCPALSCRSYQGPQETARSRPSAEDRGTPSRGPLSPRCTLGSPALHRGRVRVDRPGHDVAARGVYGCRDAPGVSGTP
jgi:hypothetical protein